MSRSWTRCISRLSRLGGWQVDVGFGCEERPGTITRYIWRDTLEPVLGEGAEAGEVFERLASMLEKVGAQGEVMPPVEMDGFVAGLVVVPETVSAREWLPCVRGQGTTFEDSEETADMEAALVRQYNGVARELASKPEQ